MSQKLIHPDYCFTDMEQVISALHQQNEIDEYGSFGRLLEHCLRQLQGMELYFKQYAPMEYQAYLSQRGIKHDPH